jgi:hypothetical protein
VTRVGGVCRLSCESFSAPRLDTADTARLDWLATSRSALEPPDTGFRKQMVVTSGLEADRSAAGLAEIATMSRMPGVYSTC